MKGKSIAERLLEGLDWSQFKSDSSRINSIVVSLHSLLKSENPDEASEAYWGIENYAFAQGELYDGCDLITSVLIASLADPLDKWVRIAVLELLFQILSGYSSPHSNGSSDLALSCHDAARAGLWLIVQEAVYGERDAALDVLGLLDLDDRVRKLI